MAENEKNQGVVMAQPKSRPPVKTAVYELKFPNLNELKQYCKEWTKLYPQPCERLIKSYKEKNLSVQLMAAEGGFKSYCGEKFLLKMKISRK